MKLNYSKVENIAFWFINQHPVMLAKLKYLVYYAYCWFLVANNKDENHLTNYLFSSPLRAGDLSPTIKEVDQLGELVAITKNVNMYGSTSDVNAGNLETINLDKSCFDNLDNVITSPQLINFLQQIDQVYNHHSLIDLDTETRQAKPWQVAIKNNDVLDNHLIYNYYSQLHTSYAQELRQTEF